MLLSSLQLTNVPPTLREQITNYRSSDNNYSKLLALLEQAAQISEDTLRNQYINEFIRQGRYERAINSLKIK